MSSDWQDDIDRLASLGKPVGEFVVSGSVLFRRLALASVLVLLGIGLIVILVVLKWHHIHILVLGPLLALGGLTLAIRSYRNLGLRVLIYPEGGILFRHDRVVAFFWEEITRLWRKKIQEHWSTAWQGSLILILEKTNDEMIQLDDALPRLGELADLIQGKTLPLMLAAATNVLEAGEAVDFGELIVHPLGLQAKKGTLALEEIKDISDDNQTLVINQKRKGGKWCTLRVSEVPNHHVVQALVSRMMKKGAPRVEGGAPG